MHRSDELRPRGDEIEGLDSPPAPEVADPAVPETAAAAATVPDEVAAAIIQPYIDKLQRLQAEFENFRRRSQQELREREDRATARIFRHILPLLDDLRQAAQADQRGSGGVTEGLRIILDKAAAVLREFSIEEIATVGEKFDPRWHEALIHRESDAQPPGAVLELLEQGYRLRDTLVRPSRVVVAKAPARPSEE